MDLALIVALIAIAVTIMSASASSTRNEAHHQATMIQDLLKDISESSHTYLIESSNHEAKSANAFEASSNTKCDLLESTFNLLIRRCSRYFLFDADIRKFEEEFIFLLGRLRNEISQAAYATDNQSPHIINALITGLYTKLNDYIGERFRPIFERRTN